LVLGPAGFNPLKQLHFRKLGCVPVGGEQLKLRASSAIPRGISVLGESDALAARGRRVEDESDRKMLCFCGS
ncbi:hypothetical protein, partial [uncultured Rikenella sp.]